MAKAVATQIKQLTLVVLSECRAHLHSLSALRKPSHGRSP